MTAAQVRTALKPFADFVPAVLKAAEIIESAETAEKALPQLRKQKSDLELSIASLETERQEAVRATDAAKDAARVERDKLEALTAEVIAMEAQLADRRADHAACEAAIKDLHGRLNVHVKA